MAGGLREVRHPRRALHCGKPSHRRGASFKLLTCQGLTSPAVYFMDPKIQRLEHCIMKHEQSLSESLCTVDHSAQAAVQESSDSRRAPCKCALEEHQGALRSLKLQSEVFR